MMEYTPFGEFMRIKRIQNHEVMGDTAKFLNVKVPFVSAVESGKKNVPEDWVQLIVEHYNLTSDEQKKLKEAIEESKTQLKVNLVSATPSQRKVALQFQRSFEKLDEKTVAEIMKVLDKENI